MPTQWYNVIPDLPEPPPPPLHPGTHDPIGPDDLRPAVPDGADRPGGQHRELPRHPRRGPRHLPALAAVAAVSSPPTRGAPSTPRPRSSTSTKGSVRPGPTSPTPPCPRPSTTRPRGSGSSPPRPVRGSGGVRWPSPPRSSTECEVWQVRASYDQKPYRKTMMEIWGATVHPSPSDLTEAGRAVLAGDPDSPGSLGIAISEAVEAAVADPTIRYALGSVLNHVLLHQTIIGEEALAQLAKVGEVPDVLVGCTGGGSNFGGLAAVPPREAGRPDEPHHPLRRTGRLSLAHQGRVPLRLRRHRRADPSGQDAHAGTRIRPRPDPRQEDCVTTACRRW